MKINYEKITTKEQLDIANSGKDVKDYTIDELRVMYYTLDSDTTLLSATKINSLNNELSIFGDFKDRFKDDFSSEAVFIGSAIHKACETNGESLTQLDYVRDELMVGATPYEKSVISDILVGKDPVEAYIGVYKTDLTLDDIDNTPPLELLSNKRYTSVLDKVTKLTTKYRDYIEYSKQAIEQGKTIVLKSTYHTIHDCFKAVVNHKEASDLLLTPSTEEVEVYNEIPFIYNFKDLEFVKDKEPYKDIDVEMKSMIDRLIVDHVNQQITIIDIKTFGKAPDEFIDSYIHWGYYRQFSLYYEVVLSHLHKFIKNHLPIEYDIIFKVVPISTKYNHIKSIETISWYDLKGSRIGFNPNNNIPPYDYNGYIQYSHTRYSYETLTKFYREGIRDYTQDKFFMYNFKIGWAEIVRLWYNNKQKQNGQVN